MSEELFSSVDLVGQCLLDKEKFDAFKKRISTVVKPDMEVLDVGTGSGILALLSAQAGAKKLSILEFDRYIAEIAKQNLSSNGYEVDEVLVGDATIFDYKREKPFDIITMEMLSTGLVDEFQVQAINNLHRQKLISDQTILIPAREISFISLAHFDFQFEDFFMKMIQYLWKHNHNRHLLNPLSKPVLLNDIDFSKKIDETRHEVVHLEVESPGVLNSICLSSRAILDKNIYLEDTNSLNPPIIVPIPERKVEVGDAITLDVQYRFGGGFGGFNISVS